MVRCRARSALGLKCRAVREPTLPVGTVVVVTLGPAPTRVLGGYDRAMVRRFRCGRRECTDRCGRQARILRGEDVIDPPVRRRCRPCQAAALAVRDHPCVVIAGRHPGDVAPGGRFIEIADDENRVRERLRPRLTSSVHLVNTDVGQMISNTFAICRRVVHRCAQRATSPLESSPYHNLRFDR